MSTYSLNEIQYLEEGLGDVMRGVKNLYRSGKLTSAEQRSKTDLAQKLQAAQAEKLADDARTEKSKKFRQFRNLHKLAPGVATTLHNINKRPGKVVKFIKKQTDVSTKGKKLTAGAKLAGLGIAGYNIDQAIKHQTNNDIDY